MKTFVTVTIFSRDRIELVEGEADSVMDDPITNKVSVQFKSYTTQQSTRYGLGCDLMGLDEGRAKAFLTSQVNELNWSREKLDDPIVYR
jgi:hypothetical protein